MKKGYFVIINLTDWTIQIYDSNRISKTSERKEETKRNTKGRKARKDKHGVKRTIKRTIRRKGNIVLRDTATKLRKRELAFLRTPPQKKGVLWERGDSIKHKTGATRLHPLSLCTRKGCKAHREILSKIKRRR